MEKLIQSTLLANKETVFGQNIPEKLIQFQKTRKDVDGDFTLVLFPFVKMLKTSPAEVGKKVGDCLLENISDIESVDVVGGFLNIKAGASFWWKNLSEVCQQEKPGSLPAKSKGQLMVEYSSPNTNKPLHLGHMRNIFLGHSVSRILESRGHEVIKTQIVNDRGIHICKSMLAWEKFAEVDADGQRETPSSTGMKGDKFVGKFYVKFDKEFVAEAKGIIQNWENGEFDGFPIEVVDQFKEWTNAKEGKTDKEISGLNDKILDLAKNQTSLLLEAKEMLVKWEAKDPQVYLLWTTMNGWVYEGFNATYDKLGIEFDHLYYESDTYLIGKDLVLEGLKNGTFFKKEDGSVWIDLTDEGLDEKLVLRADGTAVYMTQDMGTAYDRVRDYPNMEGVTYTVGNEQDYHFKVLFLILKKLGYGWADNCHHLSYGMVDLPTGKMKSREGTVVDADDLIDEVVEKAKEATLDRGHIENMTPQEVDELCQMIGLGGLKYYLLKVDPKKRMMFNPEESIELQGNTGPFIQYAHARIQSILRKEKATSIDTSMVMAPEEKEIVKLLCVSDKVLEEAASTLSPALIANHTFELVKPFNHFYQNVPIFKENSTSIRHNRLMICASVGATIKHFMYLLGVEVPDRM